MENQSPINSLLITYKIKKKKYDHTYIYNVVGLGKLLANNIGAHPFGTVLGLALSNAQLPSLHGHDTTATSKGNWK